MTGIVCHWAFCRFCRARLAWLSRIFIDSHMYSDSGIAVDTNDCSKQHHIHINIICHLSIKQKSTESANSSVATDRQQWSMTYEWRLAFIKQQLTIIPLNYCSSSQQLPLKQCEFMILFLNQPPASDNRSLRIRLYRQSVALVLTTNSKETAQ